MSLPVKIVSGGQTGVDRGALDFAIRHGLECGGWCPPGRQSESGRIPGKYPLKEVEVPDYNERTRRNILDSDATLVITAGGRLEEGTRLTLEWAEEFRRPFLHLDLEREGLPGEVSLSGAAAWLASTGARVLNVAGNRESTSPGIGEMTVLILEKLFGMKGNI
jgi:hypothetical protein